MNTIMCVLIVLKIDKTKTNCAQIMFNNSHYNGYLKIISIEKM